MNKFNEFMDKHYKKVFIFLLVLIFVNTCGNPTKVLNKKIEALSAEVDSLSRITVDKKDLHIESLKTEKRMLINTNQIFLTKERPDLRISEIDKEIDTTQNN